MTHLSEQTWRSLRAGTLEAPERAAVVRHLSEACALCDELVERLDEPALDSCVDAALAELSTAPAPPERSTFHRSERVILRQLVSARRKWSRAVPIAIAATVALVVIGLPSTLAPRQRLKGEVLRPPGLTAMVATRKGSPLEPLDSARAYPGSAELYFTYDLPQDSHVYLGRVGVDGVVEPFYPPPGGRDALEHAGLHSLTVGGTVHAYALQGLDGKQRFVLLSSPTALEAQTIPQALEELSAGSVSLEVQVTER